MTLVEQFWSQVDMSDECWEWTGTLTDKGYGVFRVWHWDRQSSIRAHRLAWELVTGQRLPLPLEPHHECENRACVRPTHLKWVTHAEHMRLEAAIRRRRRAVRDSV